MVWEWWATDVLERWSSGDTRYLCFFHFHPEALDKMPIDLVTLLSMERRSNIHESVYRGWVIVRLS